MTWGRWWRWSFRVDRPWEVRAEALRDLGPPDFDASRKARIWPMEGISLDFLDIHRLEGNRNAVHLAVYFVVAIHQADRTRLCSYLQHLG